MLSWRRSAADQEKNGGMLLSVGPMAKSLSDAFALWASVTGQRQRDRHGRMDMLNG
jgi:hypothetical protein